MEQTREIQNRILEVFKEVAKICEKNGLRYFAIGGTCLGTVRHHGFIPWDDDLDIAMPLEDFKKFLDIFQKEKPDYLELFSSATSKHDYQFFVKVMDNRTTLTENGFVDWKDTFEGVWIDIMPMSGAPESEKERLKFQKRIYNYLHLNIKIKKKFSSQTDLKSKLYWLMASPLRLFPQEFMWKRWMKLIEKYPFDFSKYTGYVWCDLVVKLIFPQEWYGDFIYLPFEDTKMRCPIGYHEFLTRMFGDYMKYPPEDKRNSGHYFDQGIIDLEHSFKDYQSGKLNIIQSKQ